MCNVNIPSKFALFKKYSSKTKLLTLQETLANIIIRLKNASKESNKASVWIS